MPHFLHLSNGNSNAYLANYGITMIMDVKVFCRNKYHTKCCFFKKKNNRGSHICPLSLWGGGLDWYRHSTNTYWAFTVHPASAWRYLYGRWENQTWPLPLLCAVSSYGHTLSAQVHKYGYNFKLCPEGNKHLTIRKENGLGRNDFYTGAGKNGKCGVRHVVSESL